MSIDLHLGMQRLKKVFEEILHGYVWIGTIIKFNKPGRCLDLLGDTEASPTRHNCIDDGREQNPKNQRIID
jgi:hypothetical protein